MQNFKLKHFANDAPMHLNPQIYFGIKKKMQNCWTLNHDFNIFDEIYVKLFTKFKRN